MMDPAVWRLMVVILAVQWTIVTCAQSCSELNIVTRTGWGARKPVRTVRSLKTPVPRVFIHHSATPGCSDRDSCVSRVKSFQNYHIDTQGWSDIGYSWLVGGDGRVYEGRGWRQEGAHTYGYNLESIGICLIGNFENGTPTEAMLQATQKLINCGVDSGYISNNYKLHGHKNAGCTACPGKNLENIIKQWKNFNTNIAKKC